MQFHDQKARGWSTNAIPTCNSSVFFLVHDSVLGSGPVEHPGEFTLATRGLWMDRRCGRIKELVAAGGASFHCNIQQLSPVEFF